MTLATRVKGLVQSTIARYPALKRNRVYYELQRFRQYRPCKVDRSLTDRPDIIDALERDGSYVLHDFVPRNVCEQMVAELETPLEQMLAGTFGGLHQIHSFVESYRIGDVDQVSPTAAEAFFANPLIWSVARAYVSPRAVAYRREADFKLEAYHGEQSLQSELPHFDDWRHRFKAFLYLTDVGPENAPFVYYTGSHRYAEWNRQYYVDYEINGPSGRYGHFFPQEMRKIVAEHGVREVSYEGRAGTLIFADTRGIHRGTTLRKGRRILLNSTFGITLPGF